MTTERSIRRYVIDIDTPNADALAQYARAVGMGTEEVIVHCIGLAFSSPTRTEETLRVLHAIANSNLRAGPTPG